MKVLLTVVLALFPLLHETSYPAEFQSCSSEGIFLKIKGEVSEVQLFNVVMNEKGSDRVCKALKEAKTITVEIDSSSQVEEPLPVYIFADGNLLQEEVLKNQEGYLAVKNPEYRYEKRLEAAAAAQTTGAKQKQPKTVKAHQSSRGYRYLFLFLVIWVVLGFLLFKDRYHKKPKKHVDKKVS